MIRNLLLATCATILLTGCIGGEKKEEWSAFIYPDKENTKRNMKSPMTFSSLKECKEASLLQIEKQGIKDFATFKCGLNCSFHDGMKLEICEKMLAPTEK